jgi:hypothetical protein
MFGSHSCRLSGLSRRPLLAGSLLAFGEVSEIRHQLFS